MSWLQIRVMNSLTRAVTFHVAPMDDLREHSLSDCWCHPSEDDDVILHHAMDGREAFETGERRPS